MKRMRHCWWRVMPVILAVLLIGPDTLAAAELLRSIGEIRELTREKASENLPVRVRGVVTSRNGRDSITVQDESAGIWVSFVEARKRQVLQTDSAILGPRGHGGRDCRANGSGRICAIDHSRVIAGAGQEGDAKTQADREGAVFQRCG